ncbi:hypothetical protein [Rhodococcus rhodochrous]|uniref:hypothetical protein n=1 Tax=Rhodococcus rhodochrous TaxID=1829 RepID=UPI00177C38D3|nr:hypothetical protein [Rhodococcus rhodochrous]QOH59825.1 hypothetical protein C6Y44_27415 [Rhodococcus rhodochrous]
MSAPAAAPLRTVAVARLRAVLDAWHAQQPHIFDGPDRYTGSPRTPVAYWLKAALDAGDLDQARTVLLTADANPVWGKCARRHMLIAAAQGGVWKYGDPAPVTDWSNP